MIGHYNSCLESSDTNLPAMQRHRIYNQINYKKELNLGKGIRRALVAAIQTTPIVTLAIYYLKLLVLYKSLSIYIYYMKQNTNMNFDAIRVHII